MKEMWNKRYARDEFVYGIQPNSFFKKKLDLIKVGKTLLPAEGEGRNAVYAASLGWEVSAFDYSTSAREKAERLCKENKVSIKYDVHSMEDADYELESFDVIAFIYAHNGNRKANHQNLLRFLKPGGILILEAFSKAQINNDTGGPKNIDLLFSIEELKDDFAQMTEVDLWEEEKTLEEGKFHKGKSSLIRMFAKK